MSLSVKIDNPQSRLKTNLLSTLVTGRDWSPNYRSNVYVDGITNTAMLAPGPTLVGWATSNTGIYAKLGLSDFTLTDSGNWTSPSMDGGGPFMHYVGASGNTGGLYGTTTATYDINQPMVVEWQAGGTANSPYGIFNCGWSATGDGSAGVSLRFYADGKAEVWKTGALVGSDYSISGKSAGYFDTQTGAIAQAPKKDFITVMLIPCRDRELLVLSTLGGGFSHIFLDLLESTADQTITDATNFWFEVPAPITATVRISKLQFESSGYIYGATSAWSEPPPTGDPNTLVFQALSSTGTATASINTSYNPYSVSNPVTLKVDLSGSGTRTPFVYGVRAWFNSTTAVTGGSGVESIDYIKSFDLDISDNIGGSHATVVFNQPAAMATAGIPNLDTQCHRPAYIQGILTGVGEPPHYIDSPAPDGTAYDLNQEIEIQFRDFWMLAEEYIFQDIIPLDGLSLADAYSAVAGAIGFTASISSAASSVTIGNAGSCSGGDFNCAIMPGDKGSEWLDRLHQTYAGTWFHNIRENGTIELTAPSDMESTSSVTLYRSVEDAIDNGLTMSQATRAVYRSFDKRILAPEANDIFVTGMDFRTGRPIIVHYRDAASANPATSPGSRPDNWLGFLRRYAWIDPTLTTKDICTSVLNLLKTRLTQPRTIVEFTADYQTGLQRGKLVKLKASTEGFGPGSDITARIKTIRTQWVQVGGDNLGQWAPTHYTAEIKDSNNFVHPLGVRGTSLNEIARSWALKALSKQLVFSGGEKLANRPALLTVEV